MFVVNVFKTFAQMLCKIKRNLAKFHERNRKGIYIFHFVKSCSDFQNFSYLYFMLEVERFWWVCTYTCIFSSSPKSHKHCRHFADDLQIKSAKSRIFLNARQIVIISPTNGGAEVFGGLAVPRLSAAVPSPKPRHRVTFPDPSFRASAADRVFAVVRGYGLWGLRTRMK